MKQGLKWTMIAVAFMLAFNVNGQLKLADIFTDNMVLQQNQKVKIWGIAKAGETVTIEASWNKKATTKANEMGEWQTTLKTPKAGDGSYELSVVSNTDTVSLKNVVTGEVWFCSGQSNMKLNLTRSKGYEKDSSLANNNYIRLYSDTKTGWQESTFELAKQFSAVGFYFGLNIHQKLDVPVGLILSAVGGSPISSYIPLETLQGDPKLSVVIDRRNQWLKDYRARDSMEYYTRLNEWEANDKKGKKPEMPRSVYSIERYHHQRGILFKNEVSLFIPYTIKGVIWYQGESNMEWPNEYEHLFSTLVTSWRNAWGQGNFPFYYVQIPPYNYPIQYGIDKGLNAPILREAQYRTLKLRNTGMAGTMDVGDPNNVHPNIKKPIGERLAFIALAKTYGLKGIEYSGPTYKTCSVAGNEVIVEFNHAKNGLVSRNGDPLWFEIAGADGIFLPATAELKGNKAVVSSNSVAEPKSIRYAWLSGAVTNVFNAEGLPAIPFLVNDLRKRK